MKNSRRGSGSVQAPSRLDGVLAPTKGQVLKKHGELQGRLATVDPVLNRITGVQFNNTSELDLRRVLDYPPNVADQLRQYVAGFSEAVRDISEKFDLDAQIARLDASNLLYLVLGKFVDMNLGPENVSNIEMGYHYEELLRRFSELSNETAGEHFTPREVVELIVNLLFMGFLNNEQLTLARSTTSRPPTWSRSPP